MSDWQLQHARDVALENARKCDEAEARAEALRLEKIFAIDELCAAEWWISTIPNGEAMSKRLCAAIVKLGGPRT